MRSVLIVSFLVLATKAYGADVEKTLSDFELHRAVKQCVEENTYPVVDGYPQQSSIITRVFSPEGKLLEERAAQANGPGYGTRYAYDQTGRLLQIANDNSPDSPVNVQYDDRNRIVSVGRAQGIKYEYNGDHLARRIEHFAEFSVGPHAAIASMPWEDGDVAFPPPSGGTITTTYIDKGKISGAEIRDANGALLRRLTRHYDEKGQIAGDELTSEEVDIPLSGELGQNFNDAQRKAVLGFMNRAFGTAKSAYRYDAQGQLIEKHIVDIMGDRRITLQYNEHYDVTSEIQVFTSNADTGRDFGLDEAGNMIPQGPPREVKPERSETRYDYEYDGTGNWTKKTISYCYGDSTDFSPSTMVKRAITYY